MEHMTRAEQMFANSSAILGFRELGLRCDSGFSRIERSTRSPVAYKRGTNDATPRNLHAQICGMQKG